MFLIIKQFIFRMVAQPEPQLRRFWIITLVFLNWKCHSSSAHLFHCFTTSCSLLSAPRSVRKELTVGCNWDKSLEIWMMNFLFHLKVIENWILFERPGWNWLSSFQKSQRHKREREISTYMHPQLQCIKRCSDREEDALEVSHKPQSVVCTLHIIPIYHACQTGEIKNNE